MVNKNQLSAFPSFVSDAVDKLDKMYPAPKYEDLIVTDVLLSPDGCRTYDGSYGEPSALLIFSVLQHDVMDGDGYAADDRPLRVYSFAFASPSFCFAGAFANGFNSFQHYHYVLDAENAAFAVYKKECKAACDRGFATGLKAGEINGQLIAECEAQFKPELDEAHAIAIEGNGSLEIAKEPLAKDPEVPDDVDWHDDEPEIDSTCAKLKIAKYPLDDEVKKLLDEDAKLAERVLPTPPDHNPPTVESDGFVLSDYDKAYANAYKRGYQDGFGEGEASARNAHVNVKPVEIVTETLDEEVKKLLDEDAALSSLNASLNAYRSDDPEPDVDPELGENCANAVIACDDAVEIAEEPLDDDIRLSMLGSIAAREYPIDEEEYPEDNID